jgi:hypothetical protein
VGIPGLLALGWHLSPFAGAFNELMGALLATGRAMGAFSALKPTVFWFIVYGLVGAFFDLTRRRRMSDRNAGLKTTAG